MIPSKVFTLKDIANHDSPNDLWMVIYNKVYDITDFVSEHPGGAEVMFDCGGIDATIAFEDVAHSDVALSMLDPYYVGELHRDDCQVYSHIKNPSSNYVHSPTQSNSIQKSKKLKKKKRKPKWKKNIIIRNFTFVMLVTLALVGFISYLYLQKIKWMNQIQ
ncbi:cytochrome b5 [[Candida] railenensis]|uniref:Cytochrome b5 n=1 Tax=[Candida] railenensis TaxID=45579 RepID=A0A9P0VXJ9_9ASCO|nr:cytochrome b5 [[Candida] railenensis]